MLTPFRIGAVIGAFATALFLLWPSSALPYDAFTWTFFAIIVACGGAFVGGCVLLWQNVRQAPIVLRRGAALLALPTLVVLALHYGEVRKVNAFVVTADCTDGVITDIVSRGGVYLRVTFDAHGDTLTVTREARWQDRHVKVGTEVVVYFQPADPKQAMLGPAGADPVPTLMWLAMIWVLGGVLLMGYGGRPLMRRARTVKTSESADRNLGDGAA